MKKTLSILLVAILIATSLVTVAFAAGTASVYGNAKTVHAGEEVTISFSISQATFSVYEMQVSYDSSVLTLVSLDNGSFSGLFQSNIANGKVAFAAGGNITGSGVLFTAKFRVAADAAPGTYPVILNVGYVADETLEDLTVSASNGSVTVECQHVWNSGVVTTEPTCTEPGVKTYTCTLCGETKTESIAATGHAWDNGVVTTEPTCTESGVKTYTCANCGETRNEAIPALGHNWTTEWSYDEEHHWHTCTRCGENCEHFGEHELETIIDEYPTDVRDGRKHDECVICGYRCNEQVIPADPGVDPMPPTGDMTPSYIYIMTGILAMLAGAAFVTMRKFAK